MSQILSYLSFACLSVFQNLMCTVAFAFQNTCPTGDKCPGFGDESSDIHCCSSTVQQGEFFCCNEEELYRQKHASNSFIQNIPKIIGVTVALVLVMVAVVLISCFFCSCCLVYKVRQSRQEAYRSGLSTSVQTSTIFPASNRGPPGGNLFQGGYSTSTQYYPICRESDSKAYDAPPPYGVAHKYPTYLPSAAAQHQLERTCVTTGLTITCDPSRPSLDDFLLESDCIAAATSPSKAEK